MDGTTASPGVPDEREGRSPARTAPRTRDRARRVRSSEGGTGRRGRVPARRQRHAPTGLTSASATASAPRAPDGARCAPPSRRPTRCSARTRSTCRRASTSSRSRASTTTRPSTGDHDIADSVTIVGTGAARDDRRRRLPDSPSAPVEARGIDRLFEIHPSAGNVTLPGADDPRGLLRGRRRRDPELVAGPAEARERPRARQPRREGRAAASTTTTRSPTSGRPARCRARRRSRAGASRSSARSSRATRPAAAAPRSTTSATAASRSPTARSSTTRA